MEINVEQFPAEVDAIVTEAISLSGYIKVVLAIIRLCAFGLRCIFFKARDWIKANEYKPPPQYDTPKHVTGNKPWVTGKISSRSAKLSDV
uniref:Movement protein n=1 Tax=Heterorhabditis bacteriophora TaxID=37862 RepID=A0A1I7WSZ9_HETBA